MRSLELSRVLGERRLEEIEDWRKRDEPRTLRLVADADLAARLETLERQQSARTWSVWAKIGAALAGGVTALGGLLEVLKVIGVIHGG